MLTADMININIHYLQAQAGQLAARAGLSYYRQNRTEVISVEAHKAVIAVRDSQSQPYTVQIYQQNQWMLAGCSCPHAARGVTCKHIIAAAYHLLDHLTAHPPNPWREVLAATKAPRRRASAGAMLLFSLVHRGTSWALTPYTIAERALPDCALEDPAALLRALKSPQVIAQAKTPRSPLQPHQVPGAAPEALALANTILTFAQMYYYGGGQPAATLAAFLPMLPAENVFSGSDAKPFQQMLRRSAERGQVGLHGAATADGLSLTPIIRLGELVVELDDSTLKLVLPNHHWALLRDTLFQYDDPGELLASFQRYPRLTIPAADQTEFVEQYLLSLAERTPLSGDLPTQQQVVADPQPRLYLSEVEQELLAALRFAYGEHELAYDPQLPEEAVTYQEAPAALLRITRQPDTEERFWGELMRHGLKRGPQPGVAALRANTTAATFLLSQVPKLAAAGLTIYGEETLLSARVNRHPPTMTFRVASGLDWFDLEAVVRFGETEVNIAELRRAIRKRERYIKLADGSIGAIPEQWLERYRHLFALGELQGDQLRLLPHQVTLLEDLLEDTDQVDAEFVRRRERLRTVDGIAPRDLPPGFAGVLRPYQKAGYDWLHFLHEYEFGGCLADDMGTGKTIQTLAFLQSLRTSGHATASSLIVLPRSLIFNWQREIARWTPDMRVLIHADQGRSDTAEEFAAYDLVLTTYGTLLRDIDLFRSYQFHYAVLDEAQAIKNPASQTARAARALRTDHRLTLTGTPVENSTLELWSQFGFLNPGMLGSLDHFRAEFAAPIEKDGDEPTAQLLRKMVSPFILRRTKAQVAPDLPERDERVLYCAMEPAQAKLYARYRDQYRALLLDMIDSEGMNDVRMRVLEGLLRLRQICNHPRLVEPDFRGQSAKFVQLLDILETLHAEGHKALVFSQFVAMLTLLREQLDQRGLRYAYLDGQTRNRAAVVDTFQDDPQLPFFLISLKAGGVGLNLTAADYVIHIDPWWNPAVEQQATDRTHRIGQNKPVFIYKLIVRDTVEEKMLVLQDRKRALADQIVSSESGIVKSLTREEVADLFS